MDWDFVDHAVRDSRKIWKDNKMDWRDKEQMLDVAANILGYGSFFVILSLIIGTIFGLSWMITS